MNAISSYLIKFQEEKLQIQLALLKVLHLLSFLLKKKNDK